MYIRLLIFNTVLLFLWSFGESTLREMETPTKTVLVNMGENTRVVVFATSSDVNDAEALAVAIKTTFADILLPNQTFFVQIKSEEWAGVFVDLLEREIPDKSVVKAIVQAPKTEVCTVY